MTVVVSGLEFRGNPLLTSLVGVLKSWRKHTSEINSAAETTHLPYVDLKEKKNPAHKNLVCSALDNAQIYCGYIKLSMQTTLLAERAII